VGSEFSMILKLYSSVGRSEGVQVKEPSLAVAVKVSTSLRSVDLPFWRTMVQPSSQPSNLISKGVPMTTSQPELRNWAAEAALARVAMVATEYFILKMVVGIEDS